MYDQNVPNVYDRELFVHVQRKQLIAKIYMRQLVSATNCCYLNFSFFTFTGTTQARAMRAPFSFFSLLHLNNRSNSNKYFSGTVGCQKYWVGN